MKSVLVIPYEDTFHVYAEDCFDSVLVLCFVMGYALQFGEIAHKRIHYYYYG